MRAPRRIRWALVALTVAVAGLVAGGGEAEAQMWVDVRGGLSVGSHTSTAAGLDMAPALSYEAFLVRQIGPRLGAFVGYVHTAFGCEEGFCLDRDLTVAGNHGAAGVEAVVGPAWVRGGLLFGTTRVGSSGESPDAGLGVLGGVGFGFGAGRVRFRPGVSWRWLSADTPTSADHAVALSAEIGLRVRLGG